MASLRITRLRVAVCVVLAIVLVAEAMIFKSFRQSIVNTGSLRMTTVGTTIYVVSLQGVEGADANNDHRLDNFTRYFAETCGGVGDRQVKVKACLGVMDKRTGYGITKSFMKCLNQAYADGVEAAFMFEDDARLFGEPLFCSPHFRQSLIDEAPKDTFLMLLGGHNWYGDGDSDSKDTSNDKNNYVRVTKSYGAYGWAIPRGHIRMLQNGFQKDMDRNLSAVSPDVTWFRTASETGLAIYRTDPLFVQHPSGYSNTWHGIRPAIAEARPKSKNEKPWIY